MLGGPAGQCELGVAGGIAGTFGDTVAVFGAYSTLAVHQHRAEWLVAGLHGLLRELDTALKITSVVGVDHGFLA